MDNSAVMWNHKEIIGDLQGNSLGMGIHKGIIGYLLGNSMGMGNNQGIPGELSTSFDNHWWFPSEIPGNGE